MSSQMNIEFVPAIRVFNRIAWPLVLDEQSRRHNEAANYDAVNGGFVNNSPATNLKQGSVRHKKVKTLFDIRSLIEEVQNPAAHSIRLPDWHGPPDTAA